MEAVSAARDKDGQTSGESSDLAAGQSAKLTASDGAASDFLGYSVAVSDDTAVVGAYAEDTAPNLNNGAVYVFVKSGTAWTQQAKLLASDGAANDNFAYSVGISGDKIIVGVPGSDAGTSTPLTEVNKNALAPTVSDQGAAIFFVNDSLAPTAAGVSVSGRVLTPSGAGLTNAVVYLTTQNGESIQTRTTSFGYFSFEDIEAGQTVVVSIGSKRFTFTPQIVAVSDNVSDLEFTGLP